MEDRHHWSLGEPPGPSLPNLDPRAAQAALKVPEPNTLITGRRSHDGTLPNARYGADSNLGIPPLPHAMGGRGRSWSLSDSGWLWARSGLGVREGGSGCWTERVLRRWFRLRRKSGWEWRPKLPLRRIMRELFFLGRERRLDSSEARWAA